MAKNLRSLPIFCYYFGGQIKVGFSFDCRTKNKKIKNIGKRQSLRSNHWGLSNENGPLIENKRIQV